MTKYSKHNIIYRLQKWIDSVPGQTFLNYAYSWGAAIVVLGALFQLIHIPGAVYWITIGMGTEVVVFFLSAFDRPFDKTADGRELPTHLDNEASTHFSASLSQQTSASINSTPQPVADITSNLALASAQKAYLEQLTLFTELLENINQQTKTLSFDTVETENINRTLTSISRVYEMQLKSASQQMSTIDAIQAQSQLLASNIEQLNHIYTRMIDAMTMNLPSSSNPTR